MQNIRVALGLCALFLIAPGCAVIEPDDRDTARVRAAVRDGESVTIPSLASDLGISEVAVIAALPESMRVKLPGDDLPRIIADLERASPSLLLIQYGDRAMGTMLGPPSQRRVRLQLLDNEQLILSIGLDRTGEWVEDTAMYFAPVDLVYLWMYRLPGDTAQKNVIGFYGSGGERIMQWIVGGDVEAIRAFDAMWDRYTE